VAKEDSCAVGLAVVNFYLSLYGSREQGRIIALIVIDEHRRRGIGKKLIQEALSAARRRGTREVEAGINEDDTTTFELCRRFGFEPKVLLCYRFGEEEQD
ncbi:MAG: GNAT family N-acetyltransferase, partial [Actinomycetota bacterium]|nr:GNAT family N-acetyltransferase [Actinomycetota bacterium]